MNVDSSDTCYDGGSNVAAVTTRENGIPVDYVSESKTLIRRIETLNGIRPVLNGPLAYHKLTAFELWREICMWLWAGVVV